MAKCLLPLRTVLVVIVMSSAAATLARASAGYDTDFYISWGDGRAKFVPPGNEAATLTLDETSGSGIESINSYLYGRFDFDIKLPAGDCAGTVTTCYLSSQGDDHDEIDFEFLGNLTGQPYIVHTNIYTRGVGGREVQFYVWFDPTTDFHTYSVVWNPKNIIFLVDGVAIRVFGNYESTKEIAFPDVQPMKIYGSIWDAEDWATMGGRVKTDWSQAPFEAFFGAYDIQACLGAPSSSPECSGGGEAGDWMVQTLDETEQEKMEWVRRNYMVYDYCTDHKRFPQGMPPECNLPNY